MDVLNYDVLKKSGYDGYILERAPEKVMQFGEGNFLRAFVDYWFDVSNEKAGWNGKCVLVQPIKPGLADMIGPMGNFAAFSSFSKVVLAFCMLFGRLEIYAMIILFSPRTWKNIKF